MYPTDERMRITNGGSVGIGTTNPTVKLTVSSTSPAVCDIHHIDGGTNDEARIILGALAANPPSNRGAGIAALNNGAGHDLLIKCSASHSVGPTEKLRVTSAGAIGIAGANYGTSGQFLKSGGSGAAVSWGDASGGIDVAHQWRVTADASGNQTPITSWELVDTYSGGGFGSAMSESSGIFTFPSTGFWLIRFQLHGASDNHSQNIVARIDVTTDNSSYQHASRAANGIYDFNNSYPSHAAVMVEHLMDVQNTSTHKVRFTFGAGQGGEYLKGSGDYTYTGATFIRLGDT